EKFSVQSMLNLLGTMK
ncbi:hypothetical protein Gasu_64170, partial [Galdieria sulphuraria]